MVCMTPWASPLSWYSWTFCLKYCLAMGRQSCSLCLLVSWKHMVHERGARTHTHTHTLTFSAFHTDHWVIKWSIWIRSDKSVCVCVFRLWWTQPVEINVMCPITAGPDSLQMSERDISRAIFCPICRLTCRSMSKWKPSSIRYVRRPYTRTYILRQPLEFRSSYAMPMWLCGSDSKHNHT